MVIDFWYCFYGLVFDDVLFITTGKIYTLQ